jgi:hypothetical protein
MDAIQHTQQQCASINDLLKARSASSTAERGIRVHACCSLHKKTAPPVVDGVLLQCTSPVTTHMQLTVVNWVTKELAWVLNMTIGMLPTPPWPAPNQACEIYVNIFSQLVRKKPATRTPRV